MDSEYTLVSIRRRRGRRERYLLTFDSEREPIELAGDVLVNSRLKPRDRLSEERIDSLLAEDERHRCRERAWSLLGRRKRSRSELHRELCKRGFSHAAAEHVVTRFVEMGYIDDLEFAKFWVLDRLQRGRFGPRRVRRELGQKGVAPDIIDRVLEPLQSSDTQRERAHALLEKWNRTARQQDPRRRRAAAANYLARRGFDPDIIWETVRELLNGESGEPSAG